ncbi:MAG: hypothetical protein WA999_15670 [Spirulinaceae cyanobacterium]
MIDIYDTLKEIQKRPPLYLGGRSIFRLESFLYGYFYVKKKMGLPTTEGEKDFEEFHDWLQERLRVKTNKSWSSILLFRSSDESKALDLFFELLEEFKQRKDVDEK